MKKQMKTLALVGLWAFATLPMLAQNTPAPVTTTPNVLFPAPAPAGQGGGGPIRVLFVSKGHVLCEPSLVARRPAGQSQGETLLTQQRVSPIAGSDRPHRIFLREMDDEAPIRAQIPQ